MGTLSTVAALQQAQSFDAQEIRGRITVTPKQAVVFRGSKFQFHAEVLGATKAYAVVWSLAGSGAINPDGLYQAPAAVGDTADIVATVGGGLADSASVEVTSPPPPGTRLAVASCYDDGTVDVHNGLGAGEIGSLSTGGHAGGAVIDSGRRLMFIALESQVLAVNLRTMRVQGSSPLPNVRFSELALLADGDVAASDNDADAGKPGVRIFRINSDGKPRLRSSIPAGETPEGLAVGDNGRTLFVSNINGNSIMRFHILPNGTAKLTGSAHTGNRPFGIAVDMVHRELFVADNDTTVVSGAKSHPGLERFALPSMKRIGSSIATGSPSSLPLGVAIDAEARHLFVSNEGDANVAVFSLPSLHRIAWLSTGLTPWLPSLDRSRHLLYVPNARGNSYSVFDSEKLRPVHLNVPTCSYPTSIALGSS